MPIKLSPFSSTGEATVTASDGTTFVYRPGTPCPFKRDTKPQIAWKTAQETWLAQAGQPAPKPTAESAVNLEAMSIEDMESYLAARKAKKIADDKRAEEERQRQAEMAAESARKAASLAVAETGPAYTASPTGAWIVQVTSPDGEVFVTTAQVTKSGAGHWAGGKITHKGHKHQVNVNITPIKAKTA